MVGVVLAFRNAYYQTLLMIRHGQLLCQLTLRSFHLNLVRRLESFYGFNFAINFFLYNFAHYGHNRRKIGNFYGHSFCLKEEKSSRIEAVSKHKLKIE